MYVIFQDMLKPVELVNCEKLFDSLPRAFPGWSFTAVPDSKEKPILRLTRNKHLYILEGELIPEPLKRDEMVDAICALVAELIRSYVHQDDSLLCLHGAAAEFAGKLVIFPSQYRAGKSILSACLAAAGVSLFCDDVLPIDLSMRKGIAAGLALRLRKPLPDNLTQESLRFIEKRNCLHGDRYLYLNLDESILAPRGRQLPVGAFVLLEREAGNPTMLEDVSEAEILQQVVWQNFARKAESPAILDAFSQLVAESKCFRLRYNRAEDAAWLLQQEFRNWDEINTGKVLPLRSTTDDFSLQPYHYRQKSGISIVEADNQSFLADRQGEGIHHLNTIGSAIWRLLAEPMTKEELAGVLKTAFPDMNQEKIKIDINILIGELTRKSLLEFGGD